MNLTEIQNKLHVPKKQWNDYSKFNYRSCEDILIALKPILTEAKATLFITDNVVAIGERNYIQATVKLIADKEYIVTGLAREPESKKGMDAAQITGTASSYARKYALAGLFLLDNNKDSDTMDNREKPKVSKVKTVEPKDDPKLIKKLQDRLHDEAHQFQIDFIDKQITKSSAIKFLQLIIVAKYKKDIAINNLGVERMNEILEALMSKDDVITGNLTTLWNDRK